MLQLRSLARGVADAGMAQIGAQLQYKASWYGLDLIRADRWFPSSKTCSGCGQIKATLTLGERTYRCEDTTDPTTGRAVRGCGLVMDRDVNAAINLARWPTRTQPAEHRRQHHGRLTGGRCWSEPTMERNAPAGSGEEPIATLYHWGPGSKPAEDPTPRRARRPDGEQAPPHPQRSRRAGVPTVKETRR
jgi:transposase